MKRSLTRVGDLPLVNLEANVNVFFHLGQPTEKRRGPQVCLIVQARILGLDIPIHLQDRHLGPSWRRGALIPIIVGPFGDRGDNLLLELLELLLLIPSGLARRLLWVRRQADPLAPRVEPSDAFTPLQVLQLLQLQLRLLANPEQIQQNFSCQDHIDDQYRFRQYFPQPL